jgi:predicted permease
VLRPLPFADPDRLVKIEGLSPLDPDGGPVRDVETYRQRMDAVDAVAGYEVAARYLRLGDARERVMAVRVEPDFFPILGVSPLHGRTFARGDAPDVAVISERVWRGRLDADPAIVGRTLVLDDRPMTIVGVMPASFQFPDRAGSQLDGVAVEDRTDVWMPLDPPLRPRGQIGDVIGRLRPSTSLAVAQSEADAIARQLAIAYPDTNRGRSVRLVPLAQAVVPPAVQRPLFLLFGAVALLLALACSNVANLVLVRLTLRHREVAIRRALGASRLRLARQFLVESLLLSSAGGIAGLVLAWWGTTAIVQITAAYLPRSHDVALDGRVFVFLFGLCALIGAGLSLVSALTLGRREPRAALQESGGHSTMGAASRRVRDGLVIAEVALACLLAIGAAVLIRELVRLKRTDPGVTTTNVVTFHVGHLTTIGRDAQVFDEIANRVERLPGVSAAGFTQLLPLQNWGWAANSITFSVRGRAPRREEFPIELRFVTPGYFRALGIPVRGRAFTASDTADTTPVLIVNETLARKAFPGEDPIGLVTTRATVVGVSGDVRQASLDRPAQPELYTPIAQNWSHVSELGLTLVVRADGPPASLIDPVRAIVRDVDPDLAVFRVKTMDEVVADSLSSFTICLDLIAATALIALLLASVGTYATISHMAAARTREFAIRLALGAPRATVVRLVVKQGARLAAAGLAAGVLGAMMGGTLLRDLPVAVRPPEMATIVPIVALISALVLIACVVPAWRAGATDPIRALRDE